MKNLLVICCLVALSCAANTRIKRQGFVYGWPPPPPVPPHHFYPPLGPPLLVEQCRTPDGNPGGCIHWIDCPTLRKLLECPNPEVYDFLHRSSCRSHGFDRFVCCPNSVPSVGQSNCHPPRPNPVLPPSTTIRPPPTSVSVLPQQCGNSSVIRDRVVGGTEAPPGAWPWMAQLIYHKNGRKSFGCAGTLISDQHVMTAAHCFKSGRTPVAVRLGEHQLGAGGDEVQEIPVDSLTAPDSYKIYSSGQDIGILKLQRRATLTAKVQPICLPTGSSVGSADLAGNKAVVAGWGAVKEDGAVSNVLMEARLPIVAMAKCQQSYSNIPGSRIDDSVLCAGNLSGGLDSCQGDSGGPLMLRMEDGRYQQVGIVSWGIGCARAGHPGIYTRVSYYLDWITSKLT